MIRERKREDLLARVSDVLRRSGVDDAEELVLWLESNLPPTLTLSSGIRTDGIYRTESHFAGEAWKYIRFFERGVVLTVTSTGAPEQVRTWLVPGGSQSEGTFQVVAGKVSFRSTDRYGTVEYEGVLLDGQRIRLRWNSLINGNTGEDTYLFFPFET
jgi:hypothetical protein